MRTLYVICVEEKSEKMDEKPEDDDEMESLGKGKEGTSLRTPTARSSGHPTTASQSANLRFSGLLKLDGNYRDASFIPIRYRVHEIDCLGTVIAEDGYQTKRSFDRREGVRIL